MLNQHAVLVNPSVRLNIRTLSVQYIPEFLELKIKTSSSKDTILPIFGSYLICFSNFPFLKKVHWKEIYFFIKSK